MHIISLNDEISKVNVHYDVHVDDFDQFNQYKGGYRVVHRT